MLIRVVLHAKNRPWRKNRVKTMDYCNEFVTFAK